MKHLMGMVSDVVYGGVHETTVDAINDAIDNGYGEMKVKVYGELNAEVEGGVNEELEIFVYGPVWGGVCDAVGVIG